MIRKTRDNICARPRTIWEQQNDPPLSSLQVSVLAIATTVAILTDYYEPQQ